MPINKSGKKPAKADKAAKGGKAKGKVKSKGKVKEVEVSAGKLVLNFVTSVTANGKNAFKAEKHHFTVNGNVIQRSQVVAIIGTTLFYKDAKILGEIAGTSISKDGTTIYALDDDTQVGVFDNSAFAIVSGNSAGTDSEDEDSDDEDDEDDEEEEEKPKKGKSKSKSKVKSKSKSKRKAKDEDEDDEDDEDEDSDDEDDEEEFNL